MLTIVLDPGHGGNDPGAVSKNGLLEKDIVLKLAHLTERELTDRYQCIVELTRRTDEFLSLSERVQFASHVGADLFVSIHVNAANSEDANGYEDFVFDGALERTHQIRNEIHARCAAVWQEYGRLDRGKKTASFFVLKSTTMPAILVEHGFITNPQDESLLADDTFLKRLAEAMADGIAVGLGVPGKVASTAFDRMKQAGWIPDDARPGKRVAWEEFATILERVLDRCP